MSKAISLEDAGQVLSWLKDPGPKDLSVFSGVDTYVLVALATLARRESSDPISVQLGDDDVSKFARSVGLPGVIDGRDRTRASEPNRTVKLARFGWEEALEVEPLAKDIARLITGGVGTSKFEAVKYVIVELLRNVAQHSKDKLGGVVAAQIIDRPGVSRRVQVAVADAGVGILAGLTGQGMHPRVKDIQTALEMSLHPHFSGTFPEGQTGTSENAGLGLYVLSELAKMTGGSFLLASRGDALLQRDSTDPKERKSFINSGGYSGTLVVFECVLDQLADFNSLFKAIRDNADKQRPAREIAGVVQCVGSIPPNVQKFLVSVASEDTAAAVEFAKSTLIPRVSTGKAIALDFTNWTVFSQSYLHALLYTTIRMAWATKTTIYVVNASPVVKNGIEWIQSYSLVG